MSPLLPLPPPAPHPLVRLVQPVFHHTKDAQRNKIHSHRPLSAHPPNASLALASKFENARPSMCMDRRREKDSRAYFFFLIILRRRQAALGIKNANPWNPLKPSQPRRALIDRQPSGGTRVGAWADVTSGQPSSYWLLLACLHLSAVTLTRTLATLCGRAAPFSSNDIIASYVAPQGLCHRSTNRACENVPSYKRPRYVLMYLFLFGLSALPPRSLRLVVDRVLHGLARSAGWSL